jgi:hypothetical protein
VPDDIITLGGAERRSSRDADESIESLFHAHYPRIVYTAFALVGDWDLAEQLAQEAYLRLWRRWRWIADPQAAGPGVCNQQLCTPLYSTAGAIWMPASKQLIRIDPARMPG